MIKYAVARRGCLADGLACDVKARLFIAPDSSGIPRSDLQIERLPRKQPAGQITCRFRHLLPISPAAYIRAHANAKEDLGWLFIQIDKANKRVMIKERIEIVLGLAKPTPCFFCSAYGVVL